jgi:uncharacterized membrane protein YbhN (UPF0104 family)
VPRDSTRPLFTPTSRRRAEIATELGEPRVVRHGRSLARGVLVAVLAAAALALLVRAFAAVDARRAIAALGSTGALAPLALVPFVVAMTLDAAGGGALLRALGRSVPWTRLFAIRVATEALHMTAPAGFVGADSTTAVLLDQCCGVPVREGAVLAVARKWLVMRAHAAYIAIGAALGVSAVAGIGRRLFFADVLPVAVALSALVPLALSLAVGATMRARKPITPLQPELATVARAGHEGRVATALFLGQWLTEACETALLVRLVGGSLDVPGAIGVEVALSLVRAVAQVAPAGLGVQDAGYATLLPAAGVAPEHAAAFVLLKRGKELVWVAVGYALLATLRRAQPARRLAST